MDGFLGGLIIERLIYWRILWCLLIYGSYWTYILSICVYSDVCNTILLFPRLEIMPFWIIPPINHHPSDVAVSIYIYIYIYTQNDMNRIYVGCIGFYEVFHNHVQSYLLWRNLHLSHFVLWCVDLGGLQYLFMLTRVLWQDHSVFKLHGFFHGHFRYLQWRYCTISSHILDFWIYIPSHSPYIDLKKSCRLQVALVAWRKPWHCLAVDLWMISPGNFMGSESWWRFPGGNSCGFTIIYPDLPSKDVIFQNISFNSGSNGFQIDRYSTEGKKSRKSWGTPPRQNV